MSRQRSKCCWPLYADAPERRMDQPVRRRTWRELAHNWRLASLYYDVAGNASTVFLDGVDVCVGGCVSSGVGSTTSSVRAVSIAKCDATLSREEIDPDCSLVSRLI